MSIRHETQSWHPITSFWRGRTRWRVGRRGIYDPSVPPRLPRRSEMKKLALTIVAALALIMPRDSIRYTPER